MASRAYSRPLTFRRLKVILHRRGLYPRLYFLLVVTLPDLMSFKYIPEKDRPLNVPYPWKFLIDAYTAHPVLCLLLWCFIVSCMLGLCVSPYEVLT